MGHGVNTSNDYLKCLQRLLNQENLRHEIDVYACVRATELLGYRRPVSSVGRAPDCSAGGHSFKPRPD